MTFSPLGDTTNKKFGFSYAEIRLLLLNKLQLIGKGASNCD